MAESNHRRTLAAWREERQLTPEQLAESGSGISAEQIREWETAGIPPVEALPHLISVARALNAPLDQLDLGPNRRGIIEGGYSFVLFARGRDGRPWRARIGSWGWPAGHAPPKAIAERVSAGDRASGSTMEAALDALEEELRMLVRAQTPSPESGDPMPQPSTGPASGAATTP
jgi:transcriptional regulator with XRE-family HTH domain